jgi:hypothetical protein
LFDVGLQERDIRSFLACLDQHFRRGSMPVTAAPGQRSASKRVILPGPQPRSYTVLGALKWNLRQQVDRWAHAMISELQVLIGIPGRHLLLPHGRLTSEICQLIIAIDHDAAAFLCDCSDQPLS